MGKVPGFRAGRRPAQPKIPVYKPVQTGDNSRKCAQVCKQGAGLCLPTGHALHFASPRGAGPALVKLPNRPDIFRRNFPPDCSILLRVYAIIKIEHLSGGRVRVFRTGHCRGGACPASHHRLVQGIDKTYKPIASVAALSERLAGEYSTAEGLWCTAVPP